MSLQPRYGLIKRGARFRGLSAGVYGITKNRLRTLESEPVKVRCERKRFGVTRLHVFQYGSNLRFIRYCHNQVFGLSAGLDYIEV